MGQLAALSKCPSISLACLFNRPYLEVKFSLLGCYLFPKLAPPTVREGIGCAGDKSSRPPNKKIRVEFNCYELGLKVTILAH